ncbi:Hypothetical predicted protein [Cloeon dipterum]|uniref:DUF4794 domain-containing protein n=1 Tax=Cloeon dipterum TaxID=197152 RepID=A0A8S1CBE4_9INSE|nr:Hypothetical predicted protein [Cloeon dipterum]
MYSQNLIVVLISTLVTVSSSPIVTPNRDSRFLFRNSLIPHFHHWQQQPQQQQQFHYRTPSFPDPEPVGPAPFDDYPVESWHQAEPEPEPEPAFTRYAAPLPHHEHPQPFVTTYSAFSSNVLTPSDQLQPPRAQQQPLRIFFLFSRFPWPLESVVQRVQNYYSTYTVPQVEPLLDEEVDLGPEPVVVEEVDEHESILSLGNATTTLAPAKDDNANTTTATRISATEKPEEGAGDLKNEQTPVSTESEEEQVTEAGATTQSPNVTDDSTISDEEPTTLASTEQVKDEATTMPVPVDGGKNEENVSATTTSELPPLDYDGEIILA